MSIETIIAADRALLVRLEEFAQTPTYQRFLATVTEHMGAESEPWFAHWLIQPAFGLGGLPIDIAGQPGGVDMLLEHLVRIAYGCA